MKYRWIAVLCLALCLAALSGAHAEATLQEDQWLYRITEDGAAEILGYADASAELLNVPTKLGGAWVTAIGDGAFADTPLLRELTVPVQVAQISDSAFAEGATLTIRAYNGSQALRCARSRGLTARNLSDFDFFEDVLDLSEAPDAAWSVQDGSLRLKAPYAALIGAGDKLYLPPRGEWTQGLPVRVNSVTPEGDGALAAYSVLSMPEALCSYHAENVQMQLDTSRMILGEGVSLANATAKGIHVTDSRELPLTLDKKFSNGVTVTGGITLSVGYEVSVEYEWVEVTTYTYSANAEARVQLKASYDGTDDKNASLSRSVLLLRAPLVGNALVGAWVDIYLRINLEGEASIYARSGIETSLEVIGDQASVNTQMTPFEAGLEAKATLWVGPQFKTALRMGFPGTKFTIDLVSVNDYFGAAAKASYTTLAPECVDLSVYGEVYSTTEYLTSVKLEDGSFKQAYKTHKSPVLTIDFLNKHWEGDTQKWQDKCTHSKLRTVDFYTGTSEIIDPVTVEMGECIGIPREPVRDGYAFLGWFTALNGGVRFNFADEIEESITLFARWLECTPTPEPSATPSPTVDPDETPAPTATPEPTEPPIVTDWYPYESIPDAAESLALCEIAPMDSDDDGVTDYYQVSVPADVPAVTISKTYNGLPTDWYSDTIPLEAIAYKDEYEEFDLFAIDLIAKTVYLPESAESLVGTCPIKGELSHIRLPSKLKSIGRYAFYWCCGLEEIDIPYGTTQIDTYAFANCTNLQRVSIPGTVLTIGPHAFSSCEKLLRVDMGEGVTTVSDYAFGWCSGLKEITLPSTLETIGEHAFFDSCFESIVIPEGVTSIGKSAFNRTKEITLPGSMGKIGDGCFSGGELEKLVLSEGITEIGDHAFAFCRELTEVSFPDTLRTIGSSAFDGTDLIDLFIPEGVISIGESAFSQCGHLKELTLPSTLQSLGDSAFAHTGIDKLVISEGMSEFSSQAFSFNTSLKEISLPSTLRKLGDDVFAGTGLETITVPEGVTDIGDGVFQYCESLRTITLPETLQTLGASAFAFTGLERIVIPDKVSAIGDWTFDYCTRLKEITLPAALKAVGAYAFQYSGIESLVLPEGVTQIGSWAFDSCRNLKRVVLSGMPQSVGYGVFCDCYSLEEVCISEGVTDLNFDMSNLPLRMLTLPGTLESISSKVNAQNTLRNITCYARELPVESLEKINFNKLKMLCTYMGSTIAEYVEENYPDVHILYLDAGDYRRVHFETQRGTKPEDMLVRVGGLIPVPETPVWSSRVFEGWCTDWHRLNLWDFENDVMPDEDITLYAKWSYSFTGTTYTDTKDRCYLRSVVEPEEDMEIPLLLNNSRIVGLMPNLVPPGVRTVHLSNIIEDVQPGTFRRATNLEAITVDEDNPYFYAVDGVLYARDGRLICYPAAKAAAGFTVPEGVTAIIGNAFAGCDYLQSLTLPGSLTTLDSSAIYECSMLERVSFTAAPTAIGAGCFEDCMQAMLYGPVDATLLTDYAAANGLSYNVYRLIYCSDGEVIGEYSLAAGEPLEIIPGPTLDERILLGWSESASATEPTDFTDYVMPTHDLTIHAVWGYAFNWEEGEAGVRITEYTGDATLIRVPETIHAERVTSIADEAFDGLSGITLVGNRGSVVEDYAARMGFAFQPLTYRLHFETDGGTQLPDQTLCATDPIAIPECRRSGYILEGWYLDEWHNRTWNGGAMPARNLTLYAGWEYDFESEEDQDINFDYRTDDDGIHVTGYTGSDTSIRIPEQINGIPVVAVEAAAFAGCSSLTYINLPDSVTEIGEYAFQCMHALSSVRLPSGLSALPKGAFQGCDLLSQIQLPEGLESIGSYAFAGCTRLSSIQIPTALKALASDAFAGCRRLKSISGGSADFTVVKDVLYSAQGKTLALFPAALDATVYGIPDGVTAIDAAVRFPTNLCDLRIPESLTDLSADSFEYRSADLVVHVPAGSAAEAFFREYLPDIALRNGEIEGTHVLKLVWPTGEPAVGVAMQLGCLLDGEALDPGAVSWTVDRPELAQITSGGALTWLHAGRISVTAVLTSDPSCRCSAQMRCDAASPLVLPAVLQEIGEEAFSGCTMEGVVLPGGAQRIGARAFADCPRLFDVHIPDSVTGIADDAFSGSPNICIICSEGSYAASYAQRLQLPYETPETH